MRQMSWTEGAAQSGVRQGIQTATKPRRLAGTVVHQVWRWAFATVLLFGVGAVQAALADPAVAKADAMSDTPSDAVDLALAGLAEDRAAALTKLEGLANAAGPVQGKAIAKWLDALTDGPERERVPELAKPLLDSPALSSGQRVEVFASYLEVLAQIKPSPVSEDAIIGLTERLVASATTDEQVSYWANLAAWQLRTQHFANAERTLNAAIKLDAPRSSSQQRAGLLRNLGVALAQQGKLEQALQAMLQADALMRELGLPVDAALVANLAGLYVYLEDWPHAREYAQRA